MDDVCFPTDTQVCKPKKNYLRIELQQLAYNLTSARPDKCA